MFALSHIRAPRSTLLSSQALLLRCACLKCSCPRKYLCSPMFHSNLLWGRSRCFRRRCAQEIV